MAEPARRATRPRRAAITAGRDGDLLRELTAELALAGSGVGFVARCLDRVVEAYDLKDAVAVVHDEVLGLQLFTAGRRPLALDVAPASLLSRGPGLYTEPAVVDRIDELEAVAHLCEIALRLDRLQYESLHDPLTGLFNRRGFDAHVHQAVSRSERHGLSFALMLVDLDGFKAVNDEFGHHGGDIVLKAVADRLRRDLRAGDIAARVGGDEFAVLVHLGCPDDAQQVLDRLHAEPLVVAATGTVSWAAGVASCPDEARSAADLLRLADRRLYETKSRR